MGIQSQTITEIKSQCVLIKLRHCMEFLKNPHIKGRLFSVHADRLEPQGKRIENSGI